MVGLSQEMVHCAMLVADSIQSRHQILRLVVEIEDDVDQSLSGQSEKLRASKRKGRIAIEAEHDVYEKGLIEIMDLTLAKQHCQLLLAFPIAISFLKKYWMLILFIFWKRGVCKH